MERKRNLLSKIDSGGKRKIQSRTIKIPNLAPSQPRGRSPQEAVFTKKDTTTKVGDFPIGVGSQPNQKRIRQNQR